MGIPEGEFEDRNRLRISCSAAELCRQEGETDPNLPFSTLPRPKDVPTGDASSDETGRKKPQGANARNRNVCSGAAETIACLSIPEPNTGCLLWLGPVNDGPRGGYGVLGRIGSRRVWAHRTAYELRHGPIPAGLVVRHSCHQPACVNTDHLSVGTIRDNAQDMKRAGRSPRGERSGLSKLTDAAVLAIRRRRANGERCAALARDYGISKAAVSMIISGRRWAHLPLEEATR